MNIRPLAVSLALVAGVLLPVPVRSERVCANVIPAEMVDTVQSKTARSGGVYRFKTTDAVTLDGISIPAGTLGYGLIRSTSAAGRHNHDGMLSLEPRYLEVPKPKGGFTRVEVSMNPTLPATWSPSEPLLNKAASRVPLPIPGLVMTGVNTIRWGRNITLGPGFLFSVIPTGNLANGPIC